MAILFQIQNKSVIPTPEILLTYPFNFIWDRDATKDKVKALKEFAYIEFFTSKLSTNPYAGYSTEVRSKKIIDELNLDLDPEDLLIKEGIKQVEDFQTNGSLSYSLLQTGLLGKEKLESLVRNINMSEKKANGTPVWKPRDLSSALLDIDKLNASLVNLSKKVSEELFESTKTRANKEISPFANPNSLD